MEIKRKYLQKYLHDIAVEQVIAEYRDKGYAVTTEENIGKFRADVIARKGTETIVIEIKIGRLTPEKKESIAGIADYVKQQENHKLLIVVATPPKEKKLEIFDIEHLLTDYFLHEIPDELDQLSTHTRLENVSDVDIDEIRVDGKYIFVKGDGAFNIELQYGSDGDQENDLGHRTTDAIPFDFDITLEYSEKKKFAISEVKNLQIDTSSFYESPQLN